MQALQGAARMTGYAKPSVWAFIGGMALQYKTTNMGQGFPNWAPPKFFTEALAKHNQNGNQQYARSFGTPNLINNIAKYYSPIFNREINALTEVVVSSGAVSCLCSAIMGLLNPGEEMILMDPSYDCYRAQIQMAGGVARSVPLKPNKIQTLEDLKQRNTPRYQVLEQDQWQIDFDLLKKTLNEKTKILLINTPHNPTGKVFTQAELEKIAEILKDYPNVIVIEDGVYEHLCFTYEPLKLPRFGKLPGQFDRTVSVYSAGKLYSATGIRVGWVIGPANLIKFVSGFHQYSIFCMHQPNQEACADSLEISMNNNYFTELRDDLVAKRDRLIHGLLNSKYKFNLWVPEGGYFIIADISNIEVPEKHYTDENNNKLTKDWAFSVWMTKEVGVTVIPCSEFYSEEFKHLGANLVRFAYCKTEETIDSCVKILSQ